MSPVDGSVSMQSIAALKAGKHGLVLMRSKQGQSQSIAIFSGGATVSLAVTQYTTFAAILGQISFC